MNNWISVKEGLPEEVGDYLCTARCHSDMEFSVEILSWSKYICENIPDWMKKNVFKNGGAFGEMWPNGLDNIEEVIAWQPLPKPYKEVSEE